jgi:transposase-like protein
MTMTQRNLQAAIRRERVNQKRKAPRYPTELREAVVEFVRAERSRGASQISLADSLDLPINTLSRWCEKYERRSRLAPVEVVSGGSTEGPILVAPSGHRVEGLSVRSLLEILEHLR